MGMPDSDIAVEATENVCDVPLASSIGARMPDADLLDSRSDVLKQPILEPSTASCIVSCLPSSDGTGDSSEAQLHRTTYSDIAIEVTENVCDIAIEVTENVCDVPPVSSMADRTPDAGQPDTRE